MNEVSETALITLRSRVIESEKRNPVITDPVGRTCLERLGNVLSTDLQNRIMNKKLSPLLTRHLALRARKYDNLALEFLTEYPDGLIVSLGCGFDTRFWRLQHNNLKYIEIDLPQVIETKQEILKDLITYESFKGSVLEPEWTLKVKSIQTRHVLFLAEGLLMYLPMEEVIKTLKNLADTFSQSRLVMEVVHEKYTRGICKKMVERKMKRSAGTTAGSYYLYGIRNAAELETYSPKLKVTGEWSYFEDKDIKPAFLRVFRNVKFMARTQYTVIADII